MHALGEADLNVYAYARGSPLENLAKTLSALPTTSSRKPKLRLRRRTRRQRMMPSTMPKRLEQASIRERYENRSNAQVAADTLKAGADTYAGERADDWIARRHFWCRALLRSTV